MKGLILAAGRGSRLGSYNHTAKCLLEVAGRRLIEYQLEACAESGVAPVALVVGYCADDVREVVGIRAEYVHNPRWESSNSLYSFLLARDWITGPVVVMNSDILFHPEILSRVLAVKGDALAYDSGSGRAPEHMKVEVSGGRLLDMSKELPVTRSAGENVGILAFSAEGARALLERAAAIAEAGGERNWLGAAVRELAAEREIRAIDIAGLPWGEIDSTFDLENVRKKVWPRIRRTTGPRKRQRRLLLGLAAAIPLVLVATLLLFASPWHSTAAAAADQSWETLEVTGGQEKTVVIHGRPQSWWLLRERESIEVEAEGPGLLRVESRVLLPAEPPERLPYVLRIQVDREYDLYRRSARAEVDVSFDSRPVGKRKRNVLELAPGTHRIAISLLGTEEALVRVRQPDEPDGPDEDADADDDDDEARAETR